MALLLCSKLPELSDMRKARTSFSQLEMQSDPFFVKSSRLWNVKMQDVDHKKNVRDIAFRRPKRIRRVIIQLLQPTHLEADGTEAALSGEGDDNIIKEYQAEFKQNDVMLGLLSGNTTSVLTVDSYLDNELDEGGLVVLKILEPFPKKEFGKNSSRDSYSACGITDLEEDDMSDNDSVSTLGFCEVLTKEDNNVWVEEDCIRIDDVEVISQNKNFVNISLGTDDDKVSKQFVFKTKRESKHFSKVIATLQTHIRQKRV